MQTLTLKSRLNFSKQKALKQACFLMCKASNSLANQALWEIKRSYKEGSRMISYGELDKLIRDSSEESYQMNYKNLLASNAQQTIRRIYDEYRSFFALLKKRCETKVKEPQFKKPNSVFKIIYAKNQYGYDKVSHEIKLGISKNIKSELGLESSDFIRHKLPEFIDINQIQEVRIQPNMAGKFYHIEIVYRTKKLEQSKGEEFLSVDLGINNFASCVTSTGDAFIFDGKKLKSYNQFYNKRMSQIQSQKDLLGNKHFTNKQKKFLGVTGR